MTTSTPAPSPVRVALDADRDRHDEDGVLALRILTVVGPLLILAAVVASLTGWVDMVNVALAPTTTVAVAGPELPPAVAVNPAPLCDTDAHCAALTAREDQRAGRVPAVAFGPAPDGGTAVSCPDGWEVTGTSVLDSRCVPSTDVVDA